MPNSIAYADILQKELDQQMLAEATSSWMDANAGEVIYQGGAEIKIPTISMDGLADYDREKGFPDGAVTLKYATYKMTQDRGRSFMLDAMDVNESNFIANAARVSAEFQRLHVIPEVDAYRYSKIAALAKTKSRVKDDTDITAENIYGMLIDDIAAVQDVVGSVQLVISVSGITAALLSKSKDFVRHVDMLDFARGEIRTKVKSLDGNPILPVPSLRFKTEYTFKNAEAGGGFEAAAEAKNIIWEIMPRTLPIGLCRTDKLRIFDPDTNQKADAWKIDYRKYHDLLVMENKMNSLLVRTEKASEAV